MRARGGAAGRPGRPLPPRRRRAARPRPSSSSAGSSGSSCSWPCRRPGARSGRSRHSGSGFGRWCVLPATSGVGALVGRWWAASLVAPVALAIVVGNWWSARGRAAPEATSHTTDTPEGPPMSDPITARLDEAERAIHALADELRAIRALVGAAPATASAPPAVPCAAPPGHRRRPSLHRSAPGPRRRPSARAPRPPPTVGRRPISSSARARRGRRGS